MKKMFGKKLAFLLAAATLATEVACNENMPAYFTTKVLSLGTYLSGYDAATLPENLKIPDSIFGVNKNVFEGCERLESVRFLGSTHIGEKTFYSCTSLKNVTFEKSPTESPITIRNYAFGYCRSLKSITFPEGGTEIWPDAFNGCTALASVTLAKDVKVITPNAFKGCTSLKEVRYKNTIKRFKDIADDGCFEKGVVIHCTDGDYVYGSDAE